MTAGVANGPGEFNFLPRRCSSIINLLLLNASLFYVKTIKTYLVEVSKKSESNTKAFKWV